MLPTLRRFWSHDALQSPQSTRRPNRDVRRRFEALEDRSMLSTLTVTNKNDHGTGSLRAAIISANATTAADTIQFSSSVRGTIKLTTGQLSVTKNLTIHGPGATELFVNGNDASRVFNNTAATTLTIDNLTIRRGRTGGNGGGVLNAGTLTLDKVIVTDNVAIGTFGGGVYNSGAGAKLTITGSTVTNNTAPAGGGIAIGYGSTTTVSLSTVQDNRGVTYGGGGIYNAGSTTVSKCTIAENIGTGSSSGAGIINDAGGTLKVFHSTIVGNISQGTGGGIYSSGTSLSVINSTIVNNVSLGGGGGGGIRVLFGSVTINNSTVTGNSDGSGYVGSAGGISMDGTSNLTMNNTVVADNFVSNGGAPDIRGALIAGSSGNFIGIGTADLTGITNGTNSNQIGTTLAPLDPRLGPLQDNGGPTFTRLPRSSSPLLNSGVNAAIPSGLTKDQRGLSRIVGGIVDIGAVEHG